MRKAGWLARRSILCKPTQSAQLLIHANPHTDVQDPAKYIYSKNVPQYVCVSSLLTVLCSRNVRRLCLMAGTHHIIMNIIQELTLSVCDLSLTPVQYYYHPLQSCRFGGLAPLYLFSLI